MKVNQFNCYSQKFFWNVHLFKQNYIYSCKMYRVHVIVEHPYLVPFIWFVCGGGIKRLPGSSLDQTKGNKSAI